MIADDLGYQRKTQPAPFCTLGIGAAIKFFKNFGCVFRRDFHPRICNLDQDRLPGSRFAREECLQ